MKTSPQNTSSRVALVLFLLLAVVVGIVVARREAVAPSPANQTQPANPAPEAPATTTDVTYQGQEGKTALELLKAGHEVETKSFSGLGELVNSIDGRAADAQHFWAFYVNDKQAQVGAGQYQTKDTDRITWKLEEIK